MIMKNKILAIATVSVLLTQNLAYAAPSDSQRIAELERRVAVLTEQVNRLLAERLERHDYRRDQNYAMYSCSLKAFTETYTAQSSNRGRARLDVVNQCRKNYDAMFCKEEAVTCETYR